MKKKKKKKKKNFIVRSLPDDVFRQNITFLYGTHQQLDAFFAKKYKPEASSFQNCHARMRVWEPVNKDQGPSYYVCLRSDLPRVHRDYLLSSLVHECIHLIQEIFERVGIPFTRDTDEIHAYYLQWVMLQCRKWL